MNERIKKIIEIKRMNAAQFATTAGINPSALSHILSGRNKPSFEVLQKIILAFPSVDATWLMTGQGNMFRNLSTENATESLFSDTLFDENALNQEHPSAFDKYAKEMPFKKAEKSIKQTVAQTIKEKKNSVVKVKKIAVFYSDNTYEEFIPSSSL